MKYFLFSDVHGEYTALIKSLDAAGFDMQNDQHILIGVGDYFDRGSENEEVLLFLKKMLDLGRIKLIRGNHDDMLLSFLHISELKNSFDVMYKNRMFINDIVYNGMNMTIAELSGQPEASSALSFLIHGADSIRAQIKERHPYLVEMLEQMVDQVLIDNYIVTHAGFTLREDNEMKVNNWTHTEKMIEKHQSLLNPDYIYIFGHWHAEKLNKKFRVDTENENKFVYKNFIGIDAKTNLTQQVTIHVIESDDRVI